MSARETALGPLGRAWATGLGSGSVPWAPGTFGSLAAALLAWPLDAWSVSAPWQREILLGAALLATFGCMLLSQRMGPTKDPSWFVLDEWAGQWLTLALLPAGEPRWLWIALGFGAFRLFDILKPPPLRRLERLGYGLGIVIDDLAAGLYALGLLWIASLLFPI